MRIDFIGERYGVLKPVVEKLRLSGISVFTPPQAEAIKKGVLEGKNFIVCSGTGSGKTLIAELASVKTALETKKTVLYLVPLKALAFEKYEEFKRFYTEFGIDIYISTGDFDTKFPRFRKPTIFILTYEKLDSLIRHDIDIFKRIGLVVIDELHEIGNINRGPVIEIIIMLLRKNRVPIIGLSATIGNASELASWLNAELVESEYRPVKLEESVLYNSYIFNKDTEPDTSLPDKSGSDDFHNLVKESVECGIPTIVFVNTRKSAESLAEQTGKNTYVSERERKKLENIAENILNALSSPTKQCKKLARCILSGTAFHHAGLPHKQRVLVETAFKRGIIRFLAATVTLVAGVNLPCRRVIIKSPKMFSFEQGTILWPVSLYKQAIGRAGRPQFDKVGESFIIAKTKKELNDLYRRYILGSPEPLVSRIGVYPVLRTYVLSTVVCGYDTSRVSLHEFFSLSFYHHQYGSTEKFNEIIKGVISDLIKWGFIEEKNKILKPTEVGKRVSQLYIDPYSGKMILDAFKNRAGNDFAYLQLISNTYELSSRFHVGRGEFDTINKIIDKYIDSLLISPPDIWDVEYDRFLVSMKIASILNDWISEKSEEDIFELYNITPGELYSLLEVARWLSYAAKVLAYEIKKYDISVDFEILSQRIKYGIKEELIPIISVKNIGRVRARKLFNSGIKTSKDLFSLDKDKIKSIIGARVKLSGENQDIDHVPRDSSQKTLLDFT